VFAHVRERRIPVVLVTHDKDDIADPERVVQLGGLTVNGASQV
jgi:putative thiamine transport system ATP-binding protein